jgi:hypothetical protein
MATRSEPTAAQALYPHLRHGERAEQRGRNQTTLSDVMWPKLSREAKANEARARERRERLLSDLRDLRDAMRR